MHTHDDKYPAPSGFEPGTSRLQAPVDMNEPSGPAVLFARRGTGMIASSSTFCLHPGRVIRDLMLCTALYGSTSLHQSSKGSCSLLVSGHNLWADCH